MPVAIIRHKVKDYAKWREGFEAHDARREAGLGDGRVLQHTNDPNDVTIILEFDDEEKFRAFVQSEELRKTTEELGVLRPISAYVCRDTTS